MRRFITLAIMAVTLAVALSIAFDLWPGLRGGAGWQWTYLPPQAIGAVAVLAAALIAYLSGVFLLRRSGRVRTLLAFAVLGGTLLTFAVVNIGGDPAFLLFTRTVSPVQTGASALATRIMAPEGVLNTLQRWPEVMQQALDQNLIHFTTSPPGQPLIHHALGVVLDLPIFAGISQPVSMAWRAYQCADTAVMAATRGEIISAGLVAFLMPLLAMLAVIPLYAILCDLTGDRRQAAAIAAWWPLVPSVTLFAPTWNTLYPTLALLVFWLLLRALKSRRIAWALAAGLVMSASTFLNISVLPLLLLYGLFTLGYWTAVARHEPDQPGFVFPLSIGAAFGVGLVSLWAGFWLISGVSPLAILAETFGAHRELVRREYAPWLILYVWDTLLFTGLPIAALAIWGTVRALRQRAFDAFDVLTLSMAATFILTDAVGIVQGENARILLFMMPFLLLMTARIHFSVPAPAQAGWIGTQAVLLLAMAAVLYSVPLDLNPTPTGPRQDIGSLGAGEWQTSNAEFSGSDYLGSFALDQYRWIGDPSAQAISYEFEWRGINPSERPYVFALVASADTDEGRITSEPFTWIAQSTYPPTCWQPGALIRDTLVLPVPPVPHPVVWEVTLTATDPRTGDSAGTLQLAPVKYP
jgi:hypothetical protein